MSRRKYDSQELGAQLRTMRIAVNLTITEVAKKLHVANVTIRGWEAGKRTPALTDLDTYLKVVGGSMTFGERE